MTSSKRKADQLEKNLGVVVDIDAVPAAEFRVRRQAGDYDLMAAGWNADYPTPDNFPYPLLGKGSAENVTGYDNPEFNSLIARARSQKDDTERRRIYQEAERLAVGRDLAIIPAFYQPILYVFDADKWTGVQIDFFGALYFERISLR